MAVVNNILNKVSLNTAKYNENLQKMRKKTQTETKEIGSAFKAMGNVWAGVAGAISAGALGTAVVKELKATETAVAGFITTAGGVEQARATFEMLQQAARDTLQPFDALKAAAQDLQRNGIAPSAEQLTTFSQIAISSGKSLETVTASFTAALQGRFKALNQLGITAKDMGDKLALTYKGTTTEIEKNSAALAGYFEKIGEENAGALDYLQSGMTGALNHLDNAWGDFVRGIAESGLGQAIADTIRVGANALDGFTAWINDNKQPIKEFFNRWSDYIKRLGDDFQQLQRDMSSWFETSQKINGNEEETTPGFLGWLTSIGKTAGEKYFELFNGSDAERAYKAEKTRLKALFDQRVANIKKGSAEYTAEVEKFNQSIVDLERKYSDKQTTLFGRVLNFYDPEDTAEKLVKYSNEYTEYLNEADRKRKEHEENLKGTTDSGDTGIITRPFGEGTGKNAANRAATDTWGAYYAKMLELQSDAMTERAKIDAEYYSKLAELDEQAGKSQTATAEEINTVRELLEAEHAQKIKELREQALAFYTESVGNEEQQIRDSYSRKMEDLEAFHADQLLSESEFLDARNALYEQYNNDMLALREKQKKKGDGGLFFTTEQTKELQAFSDGMDTLSGAFSSLTATMSQSGAKYKALFAIQKAFAVASATTNAILAWSKALGESEGGWLAALANYATAVAMTTNILTQLKGVEMHDRGGRIAAGKIGIVGEYGPEIVTGPANVTSRKDTADLARSALTGNGVQVNLYEDASRAGTVDTSQGMDGEQVINIFVSNIRRGGRMAQAMESTYQLHRYGGA